MLFSCNSKPTHDYVTSDFINSDCAPFENVESRFCDIGVKFVNIFLGETSELSLGIMIQWWRRD